MRGLRGASSGHSGHGASDAVQGDWWETFTAIQGLPQGVYAWTSVPHEPDGITTMRYALARLVLADGDRGDLVLAYTTAGEAVAPTDSEEMSVLLDAAVQCAPEPPPPLPGVLALRPWV